MWAAFTALGLWIKVAIIAGIVALFIGSVWVVYASIKSAGYAEATAKLQPQIDELQRRIKQREAELANAVDINKTFADENARLGTLAREQSDAVLKLRADGIKAQNELRFTLDRLRTTQKLNTQQRATIARLVDIVNGPPMTERDCETADNILRELLRDRVSNDTGGTTPANQPRTHLDGGHGTRLQTVPG